MTIYNLHSNAAREVEDLKVIAHDEYDKNGKMRTNRYVEYTVIGKNRTWKDFMTIRDFKRLNPKVVVKGLNKV